ncbi:type II secretion system protein GspH [Acidovorax sp. SRB_14]|uniref:GspH/FimT family pseudopilin n=1 Tax=Acidovorax sp. SRB_14 TaxID=1962699 RepID=UPI0015655288|nr:GspH/FimT family pseudopilin [Acidovorax sp. SRB_14]NMM82097.1 type II secretion system protein GspH [Acidovorax sp. SRB_14]
MSFLLSYQSTTVRRRTHGFTLIEVMVVVAIMAVLAAIAAPSFTPLVERWRVRQTTEQLQSTLYYARSEAIKRGGQVAIQKLPNTTNGCTTASGTRDWDCGWFVCADTNGNGTCNAGEPVLQRYDAPANVQVTRTGGGDSIKLNRWGLVDGAWLGFSLVPLNKSTTNPAARGVCMSSGGRIRVIPPEDIPCNG